MYPLKKSETPSVLLASKSDDRWKHKTVIEQLKKDQHGKCAYCETLCGENFWDREHFRPKSIYPEYKNSWDNLLLSCQMCNRKQKKDLFPLDGNGEPLLLNPYFDNLDEHIKFRAYS